MGRDDIRRLAGSAAEGALFVELDGDKTKFRERLSEKFGVTRVTGMNYACYTALGALLQTIRPNTI